MIKLLLHYFHLHITINACLTLGNLEAIKSAQKKITIVYISIPRIIN